MNLIYTFYKLLKINLMIPIFINLLNNFLDIILSQACSLKLSNKYLFDLFHRNVTIFVFVKEIKCLLEFQLISFLLSL